MSDAKTIILPDGSSVKLHWNFKDLSGKKFGRLTAIRPNHKPHYMWQWLCLCDCSKTVVVASSNLSGGHTKSCGCYKDEKATADSTTHGQSKIRIYKVWNAMRHRCNNPSNKCYSRYGGRGIKVCAAWAKFENFIADMGVPEDGMTIDRIDNNGNYSCGHCEECREKNWSKNCRWVTNAENSQNKSNTRFITFRGETLPLGTWAKKLGFKRSGSFHHRIVKLGWTVERAFATPIKSRKKRHNHADVESLQKK